MSDANDSYQLSGLEPSLGGHRSGRAFSGYEPLLGGLRRSGVDVERIAGLLNAGDAETRMAILEPVLRFGQAEEYAQELIEAVPPHARQKTTNWQGTFTVTQRANAIHALAVIGSYESLVPLLGVLADAHSSVREASREALTAICARLDPTDRRTEVVYFALVDALGLLPLSARKVISHILIAAPPDLVLKPLLTNGLSDAEWGARRESAWILGMLRDRRATRRLIDMLGDSMPAVRASAAWALGCLDAPIAVEPLTQVAQRDQDEVVRAAAVEALGFHAARLAAQDEDPAQPLASIVAALEQREWSVRHAAIEALEGIRIPQARSALQAYYRGRKS